MKELSIEEKAKAYDEAIKRASKLRVQNPFDTVSQMMEHVFPELKESEDEKIRKTLKHYLEVRRCQTQSDEEYINCNNFLAWLEKQGQEPRKVPIWKHWKDGICGNGEGKLIYLIKEGNDYRLSSSLSFECDYIELSELDNLMLDRQNDSFITWNKNTKDNKPPFNHSVLMLTKSGISEGEWRGGNQWLQYRWSGIVRDSDVRGWMELSVLEKQGKQKPTDEDMKEALRTEYEKGRADAFAQMQKEWSEEDEVKINRIVACLENLNVADNDILLKDVDWLKSLKERYTWKPSDEQMDAIKDAIDYLGGNTKIVRKHLMSLYDQLKKLREE